jgi:hypothetical protein
VALADLLFLDLPAGLAALLLVKAVAEEFFVACFFLFGLLLFLGLPLFVYCTESTLDDCSACLFRVAGRVTATQESDDGVTIFGTVTTEAERRERRS